MQVSTAQYKRMIDALLRAREKGDLAAIAILEGQLKRVIW
jgi:demethoxyubiquinone hydroxylase (CLK1/Coq7/Cat5 family)